MVAGLKWEERTHHYIVIISGHSEDVQIKIKQSRDRFTKNTESRKIYISRLKNTKSVFTLISQADSLKSWCPSLLEVSTVHECPVTDFSSYAAHRFLSCWDVSNSVPKLKAVILRPFDHVCVSLSQRHLVPNHRQELQKDNLKDRVFPMKKIFFDKCLSDPHS